MTVISDRNSLHYVKKFVPELSYVKIEWTQLQPVFFLKKTRRGMCVSKKRHCGGWGSVCRQEHDLLGSNITAQLGDEPLLGLIFRDTMLNTKTMVVSFALGDSKSRARQDNIKVHPINTN